MHNQPTTCALTVTYGERFHLCKSTVEHALGAGAQHVIVIDNGSAQSDLLAHEFANEPRVTLVRLGENLGSAGGFSHALKHARNRTEEFLLLLDDDNLPAPDCLENAHRLREELVEALHDDGLIIACLRSSNPLHVAVAQGVSAKVAYPPPGSFISFDFAQRAARWYTKTSARSLPLPTEALEIPFGPYGGLLVPRRILAEASGPNPKLTLYEDDTAWTHHLTQSGFRIFLCADAKIHDADAKWSDGPSASRGPIRMLSSANDVRLYYSVRNRVLFDCSRVSRRSERARYLLNKFVFFSYLWIAGLRSSVGPSQRVFRVAVKHGEQRRLDLGPKL